MRYDPPSLTLLTVLLGRKLLSSVVDVEFELFLFDKL